MRALGIISFFVFVTWGAAGFFLGYSSFVPDSFWLLWFCLGFAVCMWTQKAGTEENATFEVHLRRAINAAHREKLSPWLFGLQNLVRELSPQAPEKPVKRDPIHSQAAGVDLVAKQSDGDLSGEGIEIETEKATKKRKAGHTDKEVREYAENIGVKKF